MSDKVAASLSLMRRLPPSKIEQNLNGLLNLLPEESEELLQRVDQPLQEATDPETGRKYLLCDYNRDGDSHRSPWSNKYDPHLEEGEGFYPSERVRAMEVEFNELFDAYRELYFEGGTSSVYLWDLDNGFAGCFLIKKKVDSDRYVKSGCWDSIHVVEAVESDDKSRATYKLTTTVMLSMIVDKADVGETNWSGTLTRQAELNSVVNETKTHFFNIGRMIEDLETDMRTNLNELYIMKTREIVNSIRTLRTGPTQDARHIASLNAAVMGHGRTRTVDSESA
jgi:capping protein beta